MPFDPLSWAIGFILNTALKKRAEALFERNSLKHKLERCVQSWAEALPPELGLYPDALFSKFPVVANDPTGVDRSPAATALGTALANGLIPSSQMWYDALVERWSVVNRRLGSTASSFFRLPEDKANAHLGILAERLARTCQEDPALFQVTVLSRLDAHQIGSLGATGELRLHVLNDRVEALHYSPTQAKVRFTLTNLTPNQIKISAIRLTVLTRASKRIFRLPGVGAPHEEFELRANLLSADEHDLLASVDVQFVLKPEESDAFTIVTSGYEGCEYEILITCTADSLSCTRVFEARSDPITVFYPIRTTEGLRHHGKRSD
jgi:hypothetical protein